MILARVRSRAFLESESKQRMSGERNSTRSKVTEWRIRFCRPSTDVAKEGADLGQPGMRSSADLFSSAGSPLHGEGMRHRMGECTRADEGGALAQRFSLPGAFLPGSARNERWPLTFPCEFCNDR